MAAVAASMRQNDRFCVNLDGQRMNASTQRVFVIDDNEAVRRSMSILLDSLALPALAFASATEFLEHYDGSQEGCLVLDIRMPGMDGLELQQALKERKALLPIIFITGHADVPVAVEAMRNGAFDFLRKPVQDTELIDCIHRALTHESGLRESQREHDRLCERIATLTPRQMEVFKLVSKGQGNKQIADELGISERTVEVHRAQVMKKLRVRTLADLIKAKLRFDRSPPGG
jgi:RNA polymerase sigma factor (sigma-70 family)